MTVAGKLRLPRTLRRAPPSFMPKLRRIEGLGRHLSVVETPVAIILGSESDWETMRHAAALLDALKIGFAARIVSAHRTPERVVAFAKGAKAAGFKVIIAGAGGAAHLPGMTAALTWLPVLGVPIETTALGGQDSLFSIVQMPAGVPVGTLAIGQPGAINAALLAAAILALADPAIEARLCAWRAAQTEAVAERPSRED
jgi:5-(carboxyamino)imidazole ribonucleotide mutase